LALLQRRLRASSGDVGDRGDGCKYSWYDGQHDEEIVCRRRGSRCFVAVQSLGCELRGDSLCSFMIKHQVSAFTSAWYNFNRQRCPYRTSPTSSPDTALSATLSCIYTDSPYCSYEAEKHIQVGGCPEPWQRWNRLTFRYRFWRSQVTETQWCGNTVADRIGRWLNYRVCQFGIWRCH
jgi:hypothetical protein